MEKEKFVTGVGSRAVEEPGGPNAVGKKRVIEIAGLLDRAGYTLRSGGAYGCDTLFEEHMTKKEIYLPSLWFRSKPYKDEPARKPTPFDTVGYSEEAVRIAQSVHPAWGYLKDFPRRLHTRNVYQVLGKDLDRPSDLLVCWTGDGCNSEKTSSRDTGGTRTAIVLADRNGVPVFNLRNDRDYAMVKERLEKEIARQRESEGQAKNPLKPKSNGISDGYTR